MGGGGRAGRQGGGADEYLVLGWEWLGQRRRWDGGWLDRVGVWALPSHSVNEKAGTAEVQIRENERVLYTKTVGPVRRRPHRG